LANADVRRFRDDLSKYGIVALDTNVLIYHLEGLHPYVDLTRALIVQLTSAGLEGIVSAVSLAELLVGPHRQGDPGKVAAARDFVLGLPNATLIEVGADVADRAARLRAEGLRMPDALIAASGIEGGAEAIISNDPRLRREIDGLPAVILLDDYLLSE
jgi:predicted nucleic acid-binding protein